MLGRHVLHDLAKVWDVAIGCRRPVRAGAAQPGWLTVGAAVLLLVLAPAVTTGAGKELRLITPGRTRAKRTVSPKCCPEPPARPACHSPVMKRWWSGRPWHATCGWRAGRLPSADPGP